MKKIIVVVSAVFSLAPAFAQSKKLLITPTLSASIQHAPGAATVDVLIPGVETISLDLTQPGDATFLIKTADYNADGYKDFAFTSKAEPTTPTRYDIFLYHPEEKTFEAVELPGDGVCENLTNVRATAADKTLRVSCPGAGKTSTDIYRWETPYSLTLVKSTDNSAETAAERAAEKADAKAEKSEQRKDVRDSREEADEEE
jgi:hypothetical protein